MRTSRRSAAAWLSMSFQTNASSTWTSAQRRARRTSTCTNGSAQALESELNVHSERLVPVETSVNEPLVSAVRRALPSAQPSGSPAMSDMVFLAGIPSVKIGPGQSARSHTPDEFITAQELADGAAAYERIVGEYFAGAR